MQARKGIAVAGNMLVDYLKTIPAYPASGMLADIVDVRRAIGGCVPNTIINLAKMQSGIPLYALGRIGQDENGAYILDQLRAANVDTAGISRSPLAPTSFSDAMCAQDTAQRTFFHHRGANAEFSPRHVAAESLACDILHIGYLLLLDDFDKPDAVYGTAMARFLHDMQRRGIRTSIDVVSDTRGRFRDIVLPALPYCDYAIMNEIEGGAVSGLPPRDAEGRLLMDNICETLRLFIRAGVKSRAIIHCPEAGFCLDAAEGLAIVPSLKLPPGYIQGSVGAGDAFCAGCLHEIYHGKGAEDMLRYASAAAAANLAAVDAISGMQAAADIRNMAEWERMTL